MQSKLRVFLYRMFGIKYSTGGFFDQNGHFSFENIIIRSVLGQIGPDVYAIYIIGSCLKLNRKDTPFLPHDIDIFVQIRPGSTRRQIDEQYISIDGRLYPIHWLVYDCHPFDVYEKYGDLKFCFECLKIYP